MSESEGGRPQRGWPRAAGLFGVTLGTSIAQPTVLVAIPFMVLAAVFGVRRLGTLVAAGLAVLVVVTGGDRDAVWFLERAWALMVGGWFVALTVRSPASDFSGRALGAVAGATAAAAALLGLRGGAWATVDWAVRDRMNAGVETALQALRVMRGGEALPPALITTVRQVVEAQASVFPAMLGISSIAAVGVAWWVFRRLSAGDDQGIGPLKDFRFNDHLVWLFIAGLVLMVARWGDTLVRVGANAVVFMGALYAVRGAAVILWLSGGISLLGYVLFGFSLVFLTPLVVTGAMVIGIGDTWLDVRTRVRDIAA